MSETPPFSAVYYPGVFDTPSIEDAKAIILTPEGEEASTAVRWEKETPYVLELINGALTLTPDMVVLDYGCGIGRMSKAMIDASGCSVIGVDISADMRRLARDYVASDRFVAVSPAECDVLIRGGLTVHAAIAVWVLQHCLVPGDDIARINRVMAADGRVFVLNMPKRAVPAVVQNGSNAWSFIWAADTIDVGRALTQIFDTVADGEPDKSRTPNMAGDVGAYWMVLRSRQVGGV
jgi:ubiquinone/menaquinone biosynthesis C-methylase UbiE